MAVSVVALSGIKWIKLNLTLDLRPGTLMNVIVDLCPIKGYDCTILCNNSSLYFLISVLRWLSMKPMLLGSLERMPVAPVMTLMCLWCVVLERTSVERRLLLLSPWKESKGSPAWNPHFLLMLVSSRAKSEFESVGGKYCKTWECLFWNTAGCFFFFFFLSK